MPSRFPGLGRRAAAVAFTATALVAAAGIGVARASDHQDKPLVELNPAMDMTDVYAFPGSSPDRIVLVMNSWAFITPSQASTTTFDSNLLYQFKVDNTGDAKEDRVIQVLFTGTGASQTVEVRGPIAPPVAGAMDNTVSTVPRLLRHALALAQRSPWLPREQVAWFWMRAGDIECRMGHLDAADSAYRNGLATHPDDYRVLSALRTHSCSITPR